MKRDKVNRPIQIFIQRLILSLPLFFPPRDETLSRKANALRLTNAPRKKRKEKGLARFSIAS